MERSQKKDLVKAVNQSLAETRAVMVVNYMGLTVLQITELRKNVRATGAVLQVAKNSLVKLALKGTDFEMMSSMFRGPTAIVFANDDAVNTAKSLVEFAKKNEKLVILGGVVDNVLLNQEGIDVISKLPSLNELRGKIIGLISAPAGKIVGVLKAPAEQLARVLNAYASKN